MKRILITGIALITILLFSCEGQMGLQGEQGIQGEQGLQGEKGDKGESGVIGSSIKIGENGNWFIDNVDTGIKAQGEAGNDGTSGSLITIGDNGNWFIDGVDTGKKAQGEQGGKGDKGDKGDSGTSGSIITIGDNGNWFIDGTDTGKKALGERGESGDDGTPGSIITIGDNGNWFIDGTDTGKKALGEKGDKGDDGNDGNDGTNAPHELFNVTIAEFENGSITAFPTSARAGTVITLSITPADDYHTIKSGSLVYIGAEFNNTVFINEQTFQFQLPPSNVEVSVEFRPWAIGETRPTRGVIIQDKGEVTDGWRMKEFMPDAVRGLVGGTSLTSPLNSYNQSSEFNNWYIPTRADGALILNLLHNDEWYYSPRFRHNIYWLGATYYSGNADRRYYIDIRTIAEGGSVLTVSHGLLFVRTF